MPATYTDAEPVRKIAEELIRLYHPRLPDHRARFTYLFSDQEPESKGKRKFGDLKIISNLNAHIAEQPEDEYELPTFVCTKCRAWKCDGDLAELPVNSDTYEFCQTCYDEVVEWDWTTTANIAKISSWQEIAKMKRDGGYDPGDTNAFFILVIYKTYFDFASSRGRQASINHLLCHAGVTKDRHGDTKLFIRPHNIEEFTENVEAFGVEWQSELDRFAEVCAKAKRTQLTLLDVNDPVPDQAEQDESKLANAA